MSMPSTPTPPIELNGTGERWASAVDVPDTFLAELAEIAPVARRRGVDRSRVAGLVATRSALGARRRGALPGRRRRQAGDHRSGRGRRRPVPSRPRPADGRCRTKRCVRSGRTGVRRNRWSISPASRGLLRSTASRVSSRSPPERSGPTSKQNSPTLGLSVGHYPAELRPGHGRWLDRLPRRRPVLDALRKDRGPRRRPRGRPRRRTDRAHRWRPGGGRRTGPQPAVHRVGGHARDRDPGVAADPSRIPHATPCRLQLPVVRRRDRGVPADPAPRCNAGRAAALRRVRVARRRSPGRRLERHADRPRRR